MERSSNSKIFFRVIRVEEQVKDRGDMVVAAVEGRAHSIMNNLFELKGFNVPRAFVILPYKLSEEKAEGSREKSLLAAAESSVDKASSGCRRSLAASISCQIMLLPFMKDAASKLEEMLAVSKSDKMFLYLVDEVS